MSIPPWARWALAVVLVLGIAAGGVAANLAVLGTTEDDTALGNLSAGSIAQQGASDGPGAPGAPGTPIPPGAVVDGPPTDTPRGEEAEGDDESGSDQRDDDQDDDREDDRDDD